MIRNEVGGRINHAVQIAYQFDRSIKSIRLRPGTEIPKEVELLKEIDHPCAYKIMAIYLDHRFQHVVRSAIRGEDLGTWLEHFKEAGTAL
jgi:hypothetical protein